VATRVLAIDWSGRRDSKPQRSAIWLAEVSARGLVRLESGRTREELVEHLLAEAEHDPELVVGLDFAFSLPGWYLRQKRLDALGLWRRLAGEALTPRMKRLGLAQWLADPDLPFWAQAGGGAFLPVDRQFRRTELELRDLGLRPKSAFQLVGAGQVGRGSLYGMQALGRLTGSGFHVWPFDDARRPFLAEIYPRALAQNVRRSRPGEMRKHLEETGVSADIVDRAASSEHAFDAAVSALVMAAHLDELLELPRATGYGLEGKIWLPRLFPHSPPPCRIRPTKEDAGVGRRLVVAPDLYRHPTTPTRRSWPGRGWSTPPGPCRSAPTASSWERATSPSRPGERWQP
jgi:predicted nuclease with RNAse H fold